MGFRVPTTLYSGCHPLPRSEPTDRRRREEPPSRRCRPRGFTPPRRFQPRRRSRAQFPKLALTSPLRPGASQAYSILLAPLGFALQSFILPESRAALLDSTAFCSLAVSVATAIIPTRKPRRSPTAFPRCAAPWPARTPAKGFGSRLENGDAGCPRPSSQTTCPSCELPRTPTSAVHRSFRARRLDAAPPASKPCSPRESVPLDRTLARLAPRSRTTAWAGALVGFLPLQSLPHHDLGSDRPR
jgi:hypothetical protein